MEPISRRKFLKASAAMATGYSFLSGFKGGNGKGRPDVPVENVVILMLENRSFDQMFGALSLEEGREVDGLRPEMSNSGLDGTPIGIYRSEEFCVLDPPHGWDAVHNQFNEGRHDGFVTEMEKVYGAEFRDQVMGYHNRDDLPFWYGMADEFTLCDRWFCSLLTGTWPNRNYFHAGQSGGLKNNELPGIRMFTWPTIYDRLNEAGIAWHYYFSDVPYLYLYPRLRRQKRKISWIRGFYRAAEAGTLPPVTVIDPAFTLTDDHPPHHPHLAQAFVASVYAALANSPQWEKLLFIITYDEHGGFFDHVPPTEAPDEREEFAHFGIRVPALIVGPYVKRGYVSSVTYDHTSVLKFLEWRFDLSPLTMRDAAANNILDALDFDQEPRPAPELPEAYVNRGELDRSCTYIGSPDGTEDLVLQPKVPPVELVQLANLGLIPPELDRRGDLAALLRLIGDVLETYGAGRIELW